jgi:hypothetical protein
MQRDIIETTNKAATEELSDKWGVVVHCFVRSSMMSVKILTVYSWRIMEYEKMVDRVCRDKITNN